MAAAMLHLNTTLLILTATVTLQGFIWLLVWFTQRHLFELRLIAAGFIGFAVGLMLHLIRNLIEIPAPLFIISQNYFVHISLVVLTHGIARFTGQRGSQQRSGAASFSRSYSGRWHSSSIRTMSRSASWPATPSASPCCC